LRRVLFATCAVVLATAAYIFSLDAPAPVEAAAGTELTDFTASPPSDPSANASFDVHTYMQAGALHVEKLEVFHAPGFVPNPILTMAPDGTAEVHVWVNLPRVRLFNTKCEYVRSLHFAIPKSALGSANKLVLVNHDTFAVKVLAAPEVLNRWLQEPERSPQASGSLPNRPLQAGGCGASRQV
jgi:hypothetical protein